MSYKDCRRLNAALLSQNWIIIKKNFKSAVLHKLILQHMVYRVHSSLSSELRRLVSVLRKRRHCKRLLSLVKVFFSGNSFSPKSESARGSTIFYFKMSVFALTVFCYERAEYTYKRMQSGCRQIPLQFLVEYLDNSEPENKTTTWRTQHKHLNQHFERNSVNQVHYWIPSVIRLPPLVLSPEKPSADISQSYIWISYINSRTLY